MEIRKFKISAQKLKGFIILVFENRSFKSYVRATDPLTERQHTALMKLIPCNLDALDKEAFKALNLSIDEVTTLSTTIPGEAFATEKLYATNDRIALFCTLYEKHTGIKYHTCKADAGKMKGLYLAGEDLEQLLRAYFSSGEWWCKTKSIANFVKHFNEVRTLGKGIKNKYPNEWDEAFEKKLDIPQLKEYWKHLQSLGLQCVKRAGRTIKWERNQPINK